MMPKNPLIFALHATSRGFGYVVFEGPFAPYDWGMVTARGDKNATCLRKLEKMLDRFIPETLLLEEATSVANRSDRIGRLYKAIGNLCISRNIDVVIYKLGDIKACFASVGARTRQEIAETVARQIEAIGHRKPKPRKPWQSEDRRMSMFCAAALVLTHYQLGASSLFDELMER